MRNVVLVLTVATVTPLVTQSSSYIHVNGSRARSDNTLTVVGGELYNFPESGAMRFLM